MYKKQFFIFIQKNQIFSPSVQAKYSEYCHSPSYSEKKNIL